MAAVAEGLAGMLPAAELLAAGHLAQVGVPVTGKLAGGGGRVERGAAAFVAAVPPALLLLAAGFLAQEQLFA